MHCFLLSPDGGHCLRNPLTGWLATKRPGVFACHVLPISPIHTALARRRHNATIHDCAASAQVLSADLLSEEGCHCHGLLESWFLNNRSCKFEATSSSCGRGPSYCAGKNCTDCGVGKVEGTANTACSERECAAQEFSLLSAKRVSQERAAAENMRGYRKVHSKYLQRTRGAAGTQATTDASFGLSA